MSEPARDREVWGLYGPLLGGRPETFSSRLDRVAVSPEHQIESLERHGLAAPLWRGLETHALWSALAPGVAAAIRNARRRARVLAAESLELMALLHHRLEELATPHLFLKGPLFAARCYGGIEDRSVGDIDLLVPPRSIGTVEGVLLDSSFRRRHGQLLGRRASRFFTHHLAFSRGRQAIEVHWTPAREPGVRVDLDRCFRERHSLSVRGCRYPVPSLETSLLIQVLTVSKDLSLGELRLRSIVDVLRLVESMRDAADGGWSAVRDRLVDQGVGRLAAAALSLALRLLDAEESDDELGRWVSEAHLPGLDREHPTLGLEVFGLSPPAWSNKRRLFRLHRGGAVSAWAWWLASLPWRHVVYGG